MVFDLSSFWWKESITDRVAPRQTTWPQSDPYALGRPWSRVLHSKVRTSLCAELVVTIYKLGESRINLGLVSVDASTKARWLWCALKRRSATHKTRKLLSGNAKRMIRRLAVTPAQAGVQARCEALWIPAPRLRGGMLRGNDTMNHYAFPLSRLLGRAGLPRCRALNSGTRVACCLTEPLPK